MDARLTELEVKLTYAEDLLDVLNQTVYRQQEEIDAMRRGDGPTTSSLAVSHRFLMLAEASLALGQDVFARGKRFDVTKTNQSKQGGNCGIDPFAQYFGIFFPGN